MTLSSVFYKRLHFSVVIPVHNSQTSLSELIERVEATFSGLRLEILCVDDGSRDHSWRRLVALRRGRPHLVLLRLSRNFGQHNALLCGLAHSRGDWVMTLDDDLQHPPESLPGLLEYALRQELDVVYGDYGRSLQPGLRGLAAALTRRCLVWAIPRLHPGFGSLRVIRGTCARRAAGLATPFAFVDGSLTWVTDRFGALPVRGAQRRHGRSGYNYHRLAAYTLNIVSSFSSLPLRLWALMGLGVSAIGIAYAALLVARQWLYGDLTPGYASVMAAVLTLGGLALAGQGLLGEYLGRVNHKTSGRPVYELREKLPQRRGQH